MMMIKSAALLVALAALSAVMARAEDQIQYPSAEYGERDIETSMTGSAGTLALGAGVTPWWHTEIESEWKAGRYDSLDSENTIMLTGCYDPDGDGDCHPTMFAAALYGEYEHWWNRGRPDTLTLGPIATLNLAPIALTVNLLGEKNFGRGHDNDWGLMVYGEAKWFVSDYASPVIEYQGVAEDAQRLGRANDQAHSIGPGIVGRLGQFQYQAAWLFGMSDGATRGRPMLRLEYAF